MAENDKGAPAAPKKASKRLLFRNKSKVSQTIYVNGAAVKVLAGDTVRLTPETGLKYPQLFALVNKDDEKYLPTLTLDDLE